MVLALIALSLLVALIGIVGYIAHARGWIAFPQTPSDESEPQEEEEEENDPDVPAPAPTPGVPTPVPAPAPFVSEEWSTDEWLPCSATCGTGTQRRRVYCPEGRACDANKRPNDERSCESLAGCAYVWDVGAWSPCS